MIHSVLSRRKFIRKCLKEGGVLLSSGMVLTGCGPDQSGQESQNSASPDDPCSDLSGVPQSEIDKREQLGYQKETPVPEERCDNCNLYLPPKNEEECGKCILFEGPVHKKGYCTYWAPET